MEFFIIVGEMEFKESFISGILMRPVRFNRFRHYVDTTKHIQVAKAVAAV